MNQHHRLLRKFQRQYLIKSLLFCFIACGITAVLFSPPGLITRYSGIDLSFVLLPFLGYFIIRFISKQIGVLVFPASGDLLSVILDGIALSFGAYFFFSGAPLLARIPFLSGSKAYLENLSQVPLYLIVIIAGNTLLTLSGPLQVFVRRTISPLLSAAGWILIGLGSWQSLNTLAASWSLSSGIGLIFFISSLVMAVTKIGRYGTAASSPLLSEVTQWLAARPSEKFLGAALIAAYFVFIRGILFKYFSTAYLIEWLFFCFLSWRIFTVIKNNLEKNYVVPLNDSAWQKHVQVVDDMMDENFNKLVLMQEDFVDAGSRRELIMQLRKVLVQNGYSEDEIVVMLQPMIEYSDLKVPWYAWGFIRRRILDQNHTRRCKTLENTIQNMTGPQEI
jgi:hypothetical protein